MAKRATPFLRDVALAGAQSAWRRCCAAAGCPPRLEALAVPVERCVGRVTAESIWAERSSPPFDSAAMDGIAIRASDTVGASETTPVLLEQDAFAVVDTGDPLPLGFDAVVMREHVQYSGGRAKLRAAVAPYGHVRSIGEDICATELLLPAGHRMRPVDAAAAASAGLTEVRVCRQPVVGILPSGDELRPVGSDLEHGELFETNSLMLAGQAREAGCQVVVLPIEPDDEVQIADAIADAVRRCDLLIVIAGSSAGRDDHTAAVVGRLGEIAVHGVAVRPGHPVVLGAVDSTPVLGAPGYPVSASLSFDIFAAPMLAELERAAPTERPAVRARLGRRLASKTGLDDWVRVRVAQVGGSLVASPLPRGAGALTSLVRADGLLLVPAGVDGHHAGDEIEIELLRTVHEIKHTIVVIGSHDLSLDLAASQLGAHTPDVTLATGNVGSMDGLIALRDGLCHLAGSHLLDPDTGAYTLPYVDNVLAGHEVAVVRLVHREQGLLVAAGNPLGLRGVADLERSGVRYVNRQRGAGTRVLLDYQLARAGIDPDRIAGYGREEPTHLAVAAAIAAGRADCGMGVLAAARAFELDFVPVTKEPYDLVLERDTLEHQILAPFWELLSSAEFRSAVEALGGYDTAEMGRRIR